ncbi:MAG: type-2 restriction enzyme [Rhodocyclaceae bacterium]|uniref:Restriction endonuclease n=1 Tax=Candidatus Desulfobacillus denitrificans TaxID=2608985 RepID=A0A809SB96_9PROT|nr:restriction endonuclease [Rhodocyclaceae bacterium]BBO21434.1 restriction endonuclease [Candidatus Desulfobacillus denitrificans]GIK46225.1 MAG: type-2 restriction enzyme [Betaproteobacteria bacterium]GJQ56600.1 MAG: type-2 restriction enzyme [Rhodocyclaceae bacterium]
MIDVETELGKAVKHFWKTRGQQKKRQGAASGQKDAGNRGAVTGGKHADGFVSLIARIVSDAGLTDAAIFTTQKMQRTLPGYFRPTKEWDLVVVSGSDLVATIEVKSQVGSFGNNFNNRVEEALGNATDFWAAYRKGVYKPSQKPWLGYLFMLEEHEKSIRPTQRIRLKPFGVDEAYQELSYAKRYELVCERLVRELLYDAACFFTSNAKTGIRGSYSQPNQELSIRSFAISLHARAAAFAKLNRK